LALAKDLIDDLEAVDLNKIDGEFYWRMCRDDLLGPLSQLAESIAPHIADPARRNEQFDEAQQQAIDKYRQSLDWLPDDNHRDNHRELLIDWFKQQLKAEELFASGQQFAEQLPHSVWQHYSKRARIPMRAPMTITLPKRESAVAFRIWSRSVTGDDLDAFDWPDRPLYDSVPDPPSSSPEVDDRIMQDIEPRPVSQVSLQIDFKLVTAPLASTSTEPPEDRADRPYIQVTVWWPLPPPGVVGNAYDAIVRKQHQWHLELPGSGTLQDKEVAIRTWAVGLLMSLGGTFSSALRDLESVFGYFDLSQEGDRQARNRLFDRVPEARSCLRAR
jgi:hypothetical protein